MVVSVSSLDDVVVDVFSAVDVVSSVEHDVVSVVWEVIGGPGSVVIGGVGGTKVVSDSEVEMVPVVVGVISVVID